MKKILYIVTYLQNEPNSVGNILKVMLATIADMGGIEQIVVHERGNQMNTNTVCEIDGYKTYTAKQYGKPMRVLMRIQREVTGNKNQKHFNIEHIGKIIEAEEPDLVVLFTFSPEPDYAALCREKNTCYVYMLYDTYIGRPGIDINEAVRVERPVIEKSCAYYVPRFFCDDYLRHYDSDKIIPYDLPLLIDKNAVKAAYQRDAVHYDYTYFGQIQSFRNADQVQKICRSLGITLDIFASDRVDAKKDEIFRLHPAVSGDDLYEVAAHSRFLVAFDNSTPYNHYLPSKVYLYVSFTKPVIAFGDNENSALLEFFRDYPYFYYQNIHQPTDGLMAFIRSSKDRGFDENLYKRYLRYVPMEALTGVTGFIKKFLTF